MEELLAVGDLLLGRGEPGFLGTGDLLKVCLGLLEVDDVFVAVVIGTVSELLLLPFVPVVLVIPVIPAVSVVPVAPVVLLSIPLVIILVVVGMTGRDEEWAESSGEKTLLMAKTDERTNKNITNALYM